MQKKITITILCIFFMGALSAQSFSGMTFRAQILDNAGLSVNNTALTLKVELFTKNGTTWYSEQQQTTSDAQGFVSLVIGQGSGVSGSLNTVPWYTESIQLRLSYMRAGAGSFTVMQPTLLFAVPYAFYSLSAGSIRGAGNGGSGNNTDSTGSGTDYGLASKSDTWSVYGNRGVGMRAGFLGTTDNSPVIFKVGGLERMRMSEDGKIRLSSSLQIPSQYPAYISSLQVDSLKSSLSALNSLQILGTIPSTDVSTGALVVKGGAGIAQNLHVGNNFYVAGTGDVAGKLAVGNFEVRGKTILDDSLTIRGPLSIADATSSSSPVTGSLLVAGGAGIGDSLNVRGTIKSLKDISATGNVYQANGFVQNQLIISGAQNGGNGTGALALANGGLYAARDIWSGGSIQAGADLNIQRDGHFAGELSVGDSIIGKGNMVINGMSLLNNRTISNNPSEGALVVTGGVGIGDNLNVGGNTAIAGNLGMKNLNATGNLTVAGNSTLAGPVTVNDMTASRDGNSGALVIKGGLGVGMGIHAFNKIAGDSDVVAGRNMVAAGNVRSQGDIAAAGNTSVGKSLFVSDSATLGGLVRITNSSASAGATQGALVVAGGVGIGNNLNVAGNTSIGGNTTISGNLGINSLNATGNLTVAGNSSLAGPVTITNKTNSADGNSGALVVNGGLGIGQDVNVNGNVKVTNTMVADSVRATSGLNVNHLYVQQNFQYVGGVNNGFFQVTGNSNFNGNTLFTGNLADSGTATVSRLQVTGVSQLSGNLTAAGAVNVTNTSDGKSPAAKALQVGGGLWVGQTTRMDGNLSITSQDNPAAHAFGDPAALAVSGGANIGGNLNVNGTIASTQGLAMSGPLNIDVFSAYNDPFSVGRLKGIGYGADSRYDSYAMRIEAVNQGIAIRVNKHNQSNYGASYGPTDDAAVNTGDNFISFWDRSGNMVGRIEGENENELQNKDYDNYLFYKSERDIKEAFNGFELAIQGFKDAQQGIRLSTSTLNKKLATDFVEAAAGLGAITVIPAGVGIAQAASTAMADAAAIVKSIDGLVNNDAISFGSEMASTGEKAAKYVVERDLFQTRMDEKVASVGVRYSSSAGDYAEYLQLADPADRDRIKWGQVVGVRSGKISWQTAGAEKLMVVSFNPAVVGKMPADMNELKNYKAVAFLGQVPVRVLNDCHPGDYILPSGNNDGYAVAKNPANMTIRDFRDIVGVAWGNPVDGGFVNVAVGLNSYDIVNLVQQQNEKISLLEKRLNRIEARLKGALTKNDGEDGGGAGADTGIHNAIIAWDKPDFRNSLKIALQQDPLQQRHISLVVNRLRSIDRAHCRNLRSYVKHAISQELGYMDLKVRQDDKILGPASKQLFNTYMDVLEQLVYEKLG